MDHRRSAGPDQAEQETWSVVLSEQYGRWALMVRRCDYARTVGGRRFHHQYCALPLRPDAEDERLREVGRSLPDWPSQYISGDREGRHWLCNDTTRSANVWLLLDERPEEMLCRLREQVDAYEALKARVREEQR